MECNELDQNQISLIRQIVRIHLGLDVPTDSAGIFEKKFRGACQELGYSNCRDCVAALVARPLSRKQVEVLASHLTVGETYFFRDKKTMDTLRDHVLSPLVQKRKSSDKKIRIWSAGCSTGEEPYSLAMLLTTLISDIDLWNIHILGTDINTLSLGKAIKGRYTRWSFRGLAPWIKQTFFNKIDEENFEVIPKIREMVTFSYLNLAEDTYPSILNGTNAIDLIMCRNVLMYFAEDVRAHVTEKLNRCLTDKGYLVVSPAEASTRRFSLFSAHNIRGVTLYTKQNKQRSESTSVGKSPLPVLSETHDGKNEKTETTVVEMLKEKKSDIPKKPEVKRGSYNYAEILYMRGDLRGAINELLRCEQSTQVLYLLTKAYADSGIFSEALKWCNRLLETDKLGAQNYYLQSTILLELSKEEQALEALRRAIFLDPKFIIAHFTMANVIRKKSINEASIYFKNALRLLKKLPYDTIVPESDGLPAGRLLELIEMIESERSGR
ncbi:CheR family methyltransferase [Chitinispirillales bacterium ANBcel5]|uniref:CheR family methyltransferase n=1 Tax=Cellulosispirillum alkaliphilum TaxID=3039283 RepID=UPI002A55B8F2|nr:CheR family methyltransferase [Chitinispirillales bacterium ANBcel5]